MPKSKLPNITKLKDLRGKRVLLRLTMNVPLDERGEIINDYRLKRVLPTLKFLKRAGAKTIVLSHMSKKGGSLKAAAAWFNKHLAVGFIPGRDLKKAGQMIETMKNGGIFVLENLRAHEGEMKNSKRFARELAKLGDIYVNEDFAAAHRSHASIVSLPQYLPSYFGPLFIEEVGSLARAFKPKKPFVFILGGIKFKTKVPLVERFMSKASDIFILGALANTFIRDLGYEVGISVVDKERLHLDKYLKSGKIELPNDLTVLTKSGKTEIRDMNEVTKTDKIVDAGPKTFEELALALESAKTVIWNGPLGYYEDGYDKWTNKLAKELCKLDKKTEVIVGGGDTVASIYKSGAMKNIDFVSTAGGAMIDFLSDASLPGIDAIVNKK